MQKHLVVDQRLDKLEIAFIMLLNRLRASGKTEDGSFILEIPGAVLDSLEKMILTRPQDLNQQERLNTVCESK